MTAKALRALALAVAVASATTGCRAAPDPAPQASAPRLGLATTLPIYWVESGGIGELLQGQQEPSWVRRALETRFRLEPLDVLDEEALAGLDRLVLAQPRALSPRENVALDAWVRRGGRLLLFADPMLTQESRFHIGDKRRPQDVVLLSPILTHWGLALAFDPDQPDAERLIEVAGAAVPVALAGQLRAGSGGACETAGESILARCRIGEGRVVVLADAAVLENAGDIGGRRAALLRLTALAFD